MNNPVLSSSSSSSSSSFESLSTASDLEDPFPIYPSSSCSSYSNNSRRKGSNWAMVPPANSPRFSDDDDERDHFLDSCFLCKKPLGGGRDIYMYRGDTPFCSEECRQEQIEMDEAKEKRLKMSTRAKEKKSSKSQKIHVRAARTVVAG